MSLLCVSIMEPKVDDCIRKMHGERLAEVRLDYMRLDDEELQFIFRQQIRLIATCRPVHFSREERLERLKKAIEFGAKYVDIEYEADAEYKKELVHHAKMYNTEVIISFHDYKNTPPTEELKQIIDQSFTMGADIVKLSTMVNHPSENARILSLYEDDRRIIAFGMGYKGRISRVASIFMGAEFTYVSKTGEDTVAPGQIGKEDFEKILDSINDLP